MTEPTAPEIVKLPLWKHCLDEMRKEGVEYRKVFPASFFERHLRTTADTMTYQLSVSEIRRALLADGFFLSGRGFKGNSFVILAPEQNADVMTSYARNALDTLKKAVTLGSNTDTSALDDAQKRRHAGILERTALRLAFATKAPILAKANPGLLK
jgi:hypothetical protein